MWSASQPWLAARSSWHQSETAPRIKCRNDGLERELTLSRATIARLETRVGTLEAQLAREQDTETDRDRFSRFIRAERWDTNHLIKVRCYCPSAAHVATTDLRPSQPTRSELRATAERERDDAVARAQRAQDELESVRARLDALEEELEAQRRAAHAALRSSEQRAADAEENGESERAALASRVARAEAALAAERAATQRLTKDVASAHREADEARAQCAVAELRAEQAVARAAKAEAAAASGRGREDLEALLSQLRREMESREAEVEEARHIKTKWTNTELLRCGWARHDC